MLVWAIIVILITMVFIEVNWVSVFMNWLYWMSVLKLRVVVSIGLVFIVCNRMCTICMPWLFTNCMLMININSSMVITRFLVKDMSRFVIDSCLMYLHSSVDQIS